MRKPLSIARVPRFEAFFPRRQKQFLIGGDEEHIWRCKQIARHNSSLIKNAIQGNLAIPDFPSLMADFQEMFERVGENSAGRVADYIPQLGRVNPEQFAVAACSVMVLVS